MKSSERFGSSSIEIDISFPPARASPPVAGGRRHVYASLLTSPPVARDVPQPFPIRHLLRRWRERIVHSRLRTNTKIEKRRIAVFTFQTLRLRGRNGKWAMHKFFVVGSRRECHA